MELSPLHFVVVNLHSELPIRIENFKIPLKAHCRRCDWLVVMLKSITKPWPLRNYQTFVVLDYTLFRE